MFKKQTNKDITSVFKKKKKKDTTFVLKKKQTSFLFA